MIFAGHIEITRFIQSLLATGGLDTSFATNAPDYSTTVFIYHCLLALALERMIVAIKFMVNTNTNSTSAVPYWI